MNEIVLKNYISLNYSTRKIAELEQSSQTNVRHWLKKYNLLNLPTKKGVTVNTITTEKKKIDLYTTRYKATLESMEGASLHYVGRDLYIPFIQLRAVSNYVGERDKSKWKMQEAIMNLNETLLQYLDALHQTT